VEVYSNICSYVPFDVVKSGGVAETFREWIAVNLQLRYLQTDILLFAYRKKVKNGAILLSLRPLRPCI